MDNTNTDSSVAFPNQDEDRSTDNRDARKPRSRKWLYIVSSTVIAVILLVCWYESNYARKREELESRIKEMGGTIDYSTLETGIADLDNLLIKIDNSRWVNGALSRINETYLQSIAITDLSPLAGLTNINRLLINNNKISDLSPLAGLTNIDRLLINNNKISDLSPLAGLTNIDYLCADNNKISDLSPLTGLTNIHILEVDDNQISDLSPLAGLTNINYLNVRNNQISDLTPLAGKKKFDLYILIIIKSLT